MPQPIHDDADSLCKMESILSHPFLSLMGRENWRSAQYQIQFEFMFSCMVLPQITTRDLEAGVKIHFQSSGNLFQHNREQHIINPFYLIGVNWRPGHTLPEWSLLELKTGFFFFSLSATLLIHDYQETIDLL